MKVTILGTGRTAGIVAALLRRTQLCIWGRSRPDAQAEGLQAATYCQDIATACRDADMVVFALPVIAMRDVARAYGEVARGDQVALLAVRGVEPSFVLPDRIVRQETCVRKIGILGGPLEAFAPRPRQMGALIVGSRFAEPAMWLQAWAAQRGTLVYPTRDVVGVQIAAAIGSVLNLAVGMAAALNLGDTVRGVLLTQGLDEAGRLGLRLGAQAETFVRVAGLGALLPQRDLQSDRHVQLGIRLARQQPLQDEDRLADGLITARQAAALAQTWGLELPLIQTVHAVACGTVPAKQALDAVLHWGVDVPDAQSAVQAAQSL